MLNEEISTAQRLVKTDAYQMSIGEVVNMYRDEEIIIDPEFQRLFRWDAGQKSRLFESILLGIPLPSIFVFEREDSKWELIDGLQRTSTILEFMGLLRSPDGGLKAPSVLEATRYLPSLYNAVWEKSERVEGVALDQQMELSSDMKLAVRRSRIAVEILKRPSDNNTKYDLFQRLNAGGTPANAQELRNCIIIMANREFFNGLRELAENADFIAVAGMTDDQIEKQRPMEYVSRLLVHSFTTRFGSSVSSPDRAKRCSLSVPPLLSSINVLQACRLGRRSRPLRLQPQGGVHGLRRGAHYDRHRGPPGPWQREPGPPPPPPQMQDYGDSLQDYGDSLLNAPIPG